jgi:hypothetical protein
LGWRAAGTALKYEVLHVFGHILFQQYCLKPSTLPRKKMKIKSVPANSSTLSEERALEKLPQDAFGFRQVSITYASSFHLSSVVIYF